MIILFQNGYKVDFNEYNKTVKASDKIQSIASRAFEIHKAVFSSLGTATYKTLSNAGVSFKYIVLGYYGPLARFHPPSDIYLAVFKIVLWVLGLGWGITTNTCRLFLERINKDPYIFLRNFVGDEIDVEHIKTKELDLDVSQVSKEIRVDDLIKIFDEINFLDPNKPGYMPPSTRIEGSSQIPVEVLKIQLTLFVKRVNTREAFLATPPSYDVIRLMDFYQQIENANRLSIHKVNEDLAEFRKNNGDDVNQYSDKLKKDYNDLLQSRSRLALDLAIAGSHCGSRYMGESMSTYYNLYGESSIENKNLEDSLIEILAHERKSIAQSHIQTYMGFDTHQFNKYMSNLGKILGLPGTKNIVETFSTNFDRNYFLNLFFDEYSVDRIITVIQEKIKKSNHLRTKVNDWIRGQIKNWEQEKYQKEEAECKEEILKIIQEKPADFPFFKQLEKFKGLIQFLKTNKTELPAFTGEWDDDFAELLAEGKDWLNAQPEFQGQNPIEKSKKIKPFKDAFSKGNLSPELIDLIKKFILEGAELKKEKFGAVLQKKSKIAQVNKIMQLEDGEKTIARILDGTIRLEVAVHDFISRKRENDFIASHFPEPEKIVQEGFSKEIIEWILVSQKILLPQNVDTK